MKVVSSNYHSFPWAFEFPKVTEGQSASEHIGEINRWLLENDMRFNRDYLNFEKSEHQGQHRSPRYLYCIAFKSRDHALMFKIAHA